MPEIAEVETVRNTLKKKILYKRIKEVKILYKNMIESNVDDFKKNLVGNEFIDIKRRGKWLIFELNNFFLISHLRMEGKYFIKNSTDKIEKHEHVIITFDDNIELRYHDTRKFGRMKLIKKEDINKCEELNKQGIEPGDINLTGKYLLDKLKNKRLPIKTTLLDQTIISGLGNIYVDEVLYKSGINPLKSANKISLDEANKICESSSTIIKKAIECGGTTIRSYTSSLGVIGHYQDYLEVHTKVGQLCKKCNSKIEKIKVNGRGTYFCPKCQR